MELSAVPKKKPKCNLPLFCVALLDDDAYCYYPKSLNGKSCCLEVANICIIYYHTILSCIQDKTFSHSLNGLYIYGEQSEEPLHQLGVQLVQNVRSVRH